MKYFLLTYRYCSPTETGFGTCVVAGDKPSVVIAALQLKEKRKVEIFPVSWLEISERESDLWKAKNG